MFPLLKPNPMLRKLPALGILALVSIHAHAIDFIATNVYLTAKDQTIADEQWVFAGRVEAEGTHRNDLFLMAGDAIVLNGTFAGNIWGAGGQNANLDGYCQRNVRLTGKSVRIGGEVGGNVIAMADTVIFGTNSLVHGSVKVYANTIVQEGTIKGNADLSASRIITLGGTIEGNAKASSASDILFTREAHIAGNLTYTAPKEIFPPEGLLAGTLLRKMPEAKPMFSAERLTTKSMWFFAAFLAGIPFITLFPMTTAMAAQLVRTSMWKCLFVGFLASGLLPMLGIMSASSIIGIPLGALILAFWGIMFYLSRIIMGLVLGTLILRSVGTSIGRVLLAMAIGLGIIYLTTLIPSIGVPVQMTVLWLGMGALILALLEKRRLIIQVPQDLKKLEKLRDEQKTTPEEIP